MSLSSEDSACSLTSCASEDYPSPSSSFSLDEEQFAVGAPCINGGFYLSGFSRCSSDSEIFAGGASRGSFVVGDTLTPSTISDHNRCFGNAASRPPAGSSCVVKSRSSHDFDINGGRTSHKSTTGRGMSSSSGVSCNFGGFSSNSSTASLSKLTSDKGLDGKLSDYTSLSSLCGQDRTGKPGVCSPSTLLRQFCRFNLFSKNYRIGRGCSDEPVAGGWGEDNNAVLGSTYTKRRASYFYHRYNYHSHQQPDGTVGKSKVTVDGSSNTPAILVTMSPSQQHEATVGSIGLDSPVAGVEAAESRLSPSKDILPVQEPNPSTLIKYDDNPEELVLPEFDSVPLEVTVRLLEGERRRLVMYQRELRQQLADPNSSKKHIQWLTENIARVEQKYRCTEEEFRQACVTALIRRLRHAKRSSRSQPAIGVKYTPKSRPTIFGTVAQASHTTPRKRANRQSVGPQMLSLAQMFGSCSGYVGTDNNNLSRPELETLIFENGNLHSGPLEALIQHLVPTEDYYPDRTYTFAFLLSSRLFIRPHELLGQVFKLCVLQQNLAAAHEKQLDNEAKFERSRIGKFGPHIINLLSEWTEMFPYDFREEQMMKQLRDITQRVIALYPELRKDINNLSYNLVTKLTNLKSYEENLSRIEAAELQNSQSTDGHMTNSMDITEICPSPLALAQQLTHIELERLSMIGPEEFVQAFAKEKIKPEENGNQGGYSKCTHNLESYVQWFNRLSFLVASEITSHAKKKERVKTIEYFIDVAKECINIGNFNSLMAVIAGMNLSPVTRLKKTWAKVNKDKLKILEHQMDPSNNFGSYRSCLKAAMWRSEMAGEEREKIVIPFFSLFVKDLYFLNEGCSSKQADGSVNFQKCWQMAKQISDLIAWQQVECPFERMGAVTTYILTAPIYKESTLSLASYECEGPDTNFDKERFKQLKVQPSSPTSPPTSPRPMST